MRWCSLVGSFPILLLGLYLLWMHRFERVETDPSVGLNQIKAAAPPIGGFQWLDREGKPVLRVQRDGAVAPVAGILRLPGMSAVRFLHVRFRLSATHLRPGSEKWQDGRLLLEWHLPDSRGVAETTYLSSARFTSVSGIVDFVVPSPVGPAIPVLRIEHLGKSGILELSDLEASAVRESRVWDIGKWLLLAAAAAWLVMLVESLSGAGLLRATLVAFVWLAMVTQFAVPGPWQNQRPLISSFDVAGKSSPPPGPAVTVPEQAASLSGPASGAAVPMSELKAEGSYVLRIKMWLTPLRPFLHALLLGIPTLGIAMLVGRKTAGFVMVLLAVLIEASQVAFGYGFDAVDVADLAFDATGILLGLVLGRQLVKRLPGRIRSNIHHSLGGGFSAKERLIADWKRRG